jgi:hypothetical protein
MIALALLVVFGGLAFAIPWRRLPILARTWAVAACLNTILVLSLPTTPATSPWRPVVSRLIAIGVVLSLSLVAGGLALRPHLLRAGGGTVAWLAPLLIGALPAFLWGLLMLLWGIAARV